MSTTVTELATTAIATSVYESGARRTSVRAATDESTVATVTGASNASSRRDSLTDRTGSRRRAP